MVKKEQKRSYVWIFLLVISLVLLVNTIVTFKNLPNHEIDFEKSNCTEIIEWECQCATDGGIYTKNNCEDYDNGNYKNSGGKNCNGKKAYTCEEVYLR